MLQYCWPRISNRQGFVGGVWKGPVRVPSATVDDINPALPRIRNIP